MGGKSALRQPLINSGQKPHFEERYLNLWLLWELNLHPFNLKACNDRDETLQLRALHTSPGSQGKKPLGATSHSPTTSSESNTPVKTSLSHSRKIKQ